MQKTHIYVMRKKNLGEILCTNEQMTNVRMKGGG